MSVRVSFWLLPTPSQRAELETIMTHLAQVYNAPVFMPHITIYSGVYADDEQPEVILQQAIQGVPPLTLEVDTIRYTAQYTKTLFIQFHPSEPLTELMTAIRGRSATPSDYVLDPHLSLMYQHMREADQQHLATTLQVPQDTILCDHVSFIVSATPTLSRADVEAWEIQWQGTLRA